MNLDWLETRAYISGNSLAVIDSINHRQWSYIELNQRAVTLAHYLQRHQIRKVIVSLLLAVIIFAISIFSLPVTKLEQSMFLLTGCLQL